MSQGGVVAPFLSSKAAGLSLSHLPVADRSHARPADVFLPAFFYDLSYAAAGAGGVAALLEGSRLGRVSRV